MTRTLAIDEIVRAGLCIGCGLCESVAGPERIEMITTVDGRERPVVRAPLDADTLTAINRTCPGVHVEGADPASLAPGTPVDPIWGPMAVATLAHASDSEVRYRASSGGVLTALAQFLLDSGRVELVVHVAASKRAPMRTERHLSFDRCDVLDAAGSRYGPAAPLRGFEEVLRDGRPFAFIGKPCDVGAVRNLARIDPRVSGMRYALSMICGGASELGKSQDLLERFDIEERDLTLLRYRGMGCPGKVRVETRTGRAHELTYAEMWEDEGTWRLQSRCKICPDAIGEAADIVAGDAWPGASPPDDGPGVNALVARTAAGTELLQAAVRVGAVTLDGPLTAREMDDFNPHQVAKKRAVGMRLVALRCAGQPVLRTRRLRIGRLAMGAGVQAAISEFRGTTRRWRAGRLGESPAAETSEALADRHDLV